MSLIVDIEKAVAAALNGHAFSQPFTAVRASAPVYDLAEMKDLHVTIVPRAVEISMANRMAVQNDAQIDVAVQKKLAAADNAEIDALMGLVEEISDFIRATRQFGNAMWVKTENVPIYSPEHLREMRQFTSVLTFTMRVLSA